MSTLTRLRALAAAGCASLSAFFACTLGGEWEPPSIDGSAPPAMGEQTSSEPLSPVAQPSPSCGEGSELASCPIELSPGSSCATDADCNGQVCVAGSCRAATRGDGTADPGEAGPCVLDHSLNGTESDVDCGGSCPGCALGAHCRTGKDCSTGVCGSTGSCLAATCNDGVENQDETGVDCGGACPSCPEGQPCAQGAHCQSGVCGAAGCAADVALCCQAPRCDDGVRNGDEPFVDCGNAACGGCGLGSPCNASAQCQSGACRQGTCRRPPCADGARNGTETDTDCGGADPACARCGVGSACAANVDCASNSCVNGRARTATTGAATAPRQASTAVACAACARPARAAARTRIARAARARTGAVVAVRASTARAARAGSSAPSTATAMVPEPQRAARPSSTAWRPTPESVPYATRRGVRMSPAACATTPGSAAPMVPASASPMRSSVRRPATSEVKAGGAELARNARRPCLRQGR